MVQTDVTVVCLREAYTVTRDRASHDPCLKGHEMPPDKETLTTDARRLDGVVRLRHRRAAPWPAWNGVCGRASRWSIATVTRDTQGIGDMAR